MVDRSRFIKWTSEQIADCYSREHSIFKVARELGIGASTVHRRLLEQGVKLDGRAKYLAEAQALPPEVEAEILRRYEAGALSADLAREHGVTIYTIKQAIRRSGGSLRLNPSPTATADEIEQIVKFRGGGLSQAKIAVRLGRSQSFVSSIYRRLGIIDEKRTGAAHGSWKGGRAEAQGYWRVKLEPSDPMISMANVHGYVLEHRVVLARKLGRPLRPDETVHHVNGDKKDNRPENLQLRQGRHGKGVVMRCADCGSLHVVPMEIEGDN